MPTPRQPDQPQTIHLLTCPHCTQPMRIMAIELAHRRECITLICDDCNIEASQDTEI